MYCNNCGSQIDDNAVVCIHCGAATPNAQKQQEAAPKQSNTIALVGFVFSFIMPLIGLICSIIGLKHAPQYNGNGKGFAIAGIIISALYFVILLIVIIVTVAVIGEAADSLSGTYYAIFA
ncbi:MAG: zinc-ribbon domain-containing protein [Clostridia bacterium]|nr:zinc-ribbon domain-containing protein [Clostridia bacterium]